MPRALPNLDWLQVFAAAAEEESFALAAARLGVTPGAVSQRIKSLEASIGVALFQRHTQGVTLTDAGRRYARRVGPHLEQLALATREIASPSAGRSVRITILPAFAQLWLGPRMDLFHARHANTTVEIWADATVVDLRASNFDLAIRYGRPPFPGCDHQPLQLDELVPVASPALLAKSRLDARGLPANVPLMVDAYWENDLDDWLAATRQSRPARLSTQTFSLYAMAIEATVNGRGFIVGHTSLLGTLLKDRRLSALSDRRVPSANQFYVLTKSATPLPEPAEAFRDWLVEQARLPA